MMMQRTMMVVLLTALLALPAWALDFKPGKYKISTKVDMPGMSGGMPSQTMIQCLTEQEPVPNSSADAKGCKVENMDTKGNTVTYTIKCDQQGMQMESTGQITYNKDRFEGTTHTKMGPASGGMTITTNIKGQRMGDCN
jgi:hypothetical protein